MPRFAKLAWAALGYNLLVIVWGAYVRASGSGAGCGAHWPLCNGEIVPRAPALKTLIELSHRVSSGLVLVIAVAMAVFAFRSFPRGSRVRRGAVTVLALTVAEALIGAGLVLFALVAHDTSMKRALSMSLHLVNTFFLVGALTLTASWASAEAAAPADEPAGVAPRAPRKGEPLLRALLIVTAAGLLLAAISGGIAALGDTLFPATSFVEGFRQELSTGAHVFLRLRVLHPVFAIASALLVIATGAIARTIRPEPAVARWSRVAAALVAAQLVLGLLNVALLAPIGVQLVHLLLADLVWIAFVLLYGAVRSERPMAYVRSTTRLRPPRFAS
jgi:heme A synthase